MKEKLLSIIMPTYNRAHLLILTLSYFKEQITRNDEEVELIVCNNVSTDNTHELLLSYHSENPFFSIIEYDTHNEGGDAVIRPVLNAKGKFFIAFGDDDVPAPFMVDVLLYELKKYPDIGKLVFNRLVAQTKADSFDMESMYLMGTADFGNGEVYYEDFSMFADEHQHEQGFVSVSVVRTESFMSRCQDVYPNNHLGFEHVVPFMYAAMNRPALYLQYPLLIQRRPSLANKNYSHDFSGEKQFLYFNIGRPRTVSAQGDLGMLKDWHKTLYALTYRNGVTKEMKLKEFFNECISQSRFMLPYADEWIALHSDSDISLMLKRLLKTEGREYTYWKIYYKIKLYGLYPYLKEKLKWVLHI